MDLRAAPYRAVIVDFGGVLTTPLIQGLDAFATEIGVDLQDVVRAALGAYAGVEDSLVTDFELGRIDEGAFTEKFARRLSELGGGEISPEGLVARMWRVRLEEDMLAMIERLRRAGLLTALVSNSWGDSLYPRARLEELFDVIVLSYEVGLRKPDPSIFRLTLDRLGAKAVECIFVDDDPGHVQAAAAVGMRTVLHMNPAQTVAQLEALLARPQA
jgi:putative hydrolase of the HAD superfamily